MKLTKLTKALYFVLALVLVSVLVFAFTMSADTITTVQGAQNVPYPVFLDNNESVAGFQVEIDYSTTDLELVDVQATSRLSDATIVYNDNPTIVKIAVLVNDDSDLITPGTDAVLNLIFNVDESATTGDNDVLLSNIVVSDIDTTVTTTSLVDGIITIVEPYNITFLPPISTEENFTLNNGSTLPFKFDVQNSTGFVVDESVEVRVHNVTLGIDETYVHGTGNGFVNIDESEEQYHVNIQTNQLSMPLGNYSIDVSFDTSQIEGIGFELIVQGQGKGKKK